MILLQLFWTFFKVGAFTFGGGYAMLSLISDAVLQHGWMSEADLLNFTGLETVIPGPISVNMATHIGYEQAGFLGALVATLGVVLPSFIVILIVAAFLKSLLRYDTIRAFISSVRPAIGGLILSVGVTMGLKVMLGLDAIKSSTVSFDWRSLIVLAAVIVIPPVWKCISKKKASSLVLVAISALLGIALFGWS